MMMGQVPMQMAGQPRMMIRNIAQQQQGGNLRQVNIIEEVILVLVFVSFTKDLL
jgi:hypothetical protein